MKQANIIIKLTDQELNDVKNLLRLVDNKLAKALIKNKIGYIGVNLLEQINSQMNNFKDVE